MQAIEPHILNRTIMVVDDEPELLEMIGAILRSRGFSQVNLFSSPIQALSSFEDSANIPDLALLDVMMPELDGIALLGEIHSRCAPKRLPAIFLTARDEPVDRLNGLGSGADDYITKPFLPEELVLRLVAVLRRCYPATDDILDLGFSKVSLESAEVMRPDENRTLTAKELAILKVLAENRGRIVTFDAIAQNCWGSTFGYENTIMAHVRRLREKIEQDPSNPTALITAKGLGYKLKVES